MNKEVKKIYTAHMMARHSFFGGKVWAIYSNNEVVSVSRVFRDEERPTDYFVRGKGRQRVGDKRVEKLSLEVDVSSYDGIAEAVEKYGELATLYLLGFDEQSYGDAYPYSQIMSFSTKHRERNIRFWNFVAEFDGCLLKWATDKGVQFRVSGENGLTYDLWLEMGDKEAYNKEEGFWQTEWRQNPFLGFSGVETIIMGIIWKEYPTLDPIRFDEALWKLVYFIERFKYQGNIPKAELAKLSKEYHGKSLAGWVKEIAGEQAVEQFKKYLEYE